MPRLRLEGVVLAGDSSHAVLIGTTDGGSVRISASCSIELGMLLWMAQAATGPIEIEVPDASVGPIEEIDPDAG